jgi:hypothetical protein
VKAVIPQKKRDDGKRRAQGYFQPFIGHCSGLSALSAGHTSV